MKSIYNYFKRKYNESTSNKWISYLIFIGLGLSATVWFLIRVIPKPSRATYPCMQAAAPLMSALVIYLISLCGGFKAFAKSKHLLKQGKIGWATCFIFIGLCFGIVFTFNNAKDIYANFAETGNAAPVFMLPPNAPQGEAKGIFPGRVAWVHAPNTANWDETTGFWFEDRWNNQTNCDQMIRQSLLTLTGKDNEKEAWASLFSYFNKNKEKRTLTYQKGEKIAVKINQNNTYSHEDSEELNASPHLTLSLLRSLVNEAGVPQENITVMEPSRFITDYLYNKCVAEFPRVQFVDNGGGNGRIKSSYISDAIPYSANNGKLATGLATCLKEADYVINMALLKGHVGQGVTLCAKNWYGVTDIHADWRKNAHNNFNQDRKGKAQYMTFVDYMGHQYTGEKTLIYFIDGLYGSESVNGKPTGKWNLKPFNGNWPNSLFASQDPVAVDAVGLDFLSSEFPGMVDINYADMYMLEAALANNPPSGTFYDPEKDGTGLKSLGVVEHWNNPIDKKYSRNLGKKEGIELVLKQLGVRQLPMIEY
jgi:hypothetical protein